MSATGNIWDYKAETLGANGEYRKVKFRGTGTMAAADVDVELTFKTDTPSLHYVEGGLHVVVRKGVRYTLKGRDINETGTFDSVVCISEPSYRDVVVCKNKDVMLRYNANFRGRGKYTVEIGAVDVNG
jgi:hypothetical protein